MLLSEVWRTVNPLRVDVDRVGEPVDAHRVLGAAAVAQDRAERVVDVHLVKLLLGLLAVEQLVPAPPLSLAAASADGATNPASSESMARASKVAAAGCGLV